MNSLLLLSIRENSTFDFNYLSGGLPTFYAAVYNLTNKYYANHSTLVAGDFKTSDDYRREMGRDIRLSVKYDF